jgi:Dynein heavy chain, N-terminal region 2
LWCGSATPQPGRKRRSTGDEITEVIDFEQALDSKDIDIEDLQNGQYKVKYTIPEPKEVVNVCVNVVNEKDQEEITRGMPVKVSFVAEQKPEANEMAGPLMQEYFRSQLEQIERTQVKIKEGLTLQDKDYEKNIEDLLEIKRNIQKLNSLKEEYQLTLDIVEQALETLEADGHGRPKELVKCKKLNNELQTLEKMSTQTEKDIHPCVVQESERTQEQIKNFEDELKRFLVDLKRKEVYQYATGIEASMEILELIDAQIQGFDEVLKVKEKHSRRFEFPEATLQASKVLEQIKSDKNAILLLWEHVKKCHELFEEYKNKSWAEIDAMTMADEVKQKNKELTTLKNVDKKCNTFVGISKDLRNWTNFLPLIYEMKDDAMNSRTTATGRRFGTTSTTSLSSARTHPCRSSGTIGSTTTRKRR